MTCGKYHFPFYSCLRGCNQVNLILNEILMSGNEISTITFAMYCLQLLLLPSQIISFLIRRMDKTRLRYLVFSLSFVCFNTTWIFLGTSKSVDFFMWESVLQINGIVLLTAVYFYIEKELGIYSGFKPFSKIIISASTLVFLKWLSTYFFASSENSFNLLFFFLSISISIYFSSVSILKLIKAKEFNRNPILVTGIVTFCLIGISPIVLFFVSEIYIKNLFINLCFLIVSFAYFKQYVSQLLSEHNKIETNNYFTKLNLNDRYKGNLDLYLNYDLSSRECQIAELLLEGMTYQELSIKFSRSYDAMRKHGSNIFKKVGVSSLDEFRDKFR